jgi:hypothetical protein
MYMRKTPPARHVGRPTRRSDGALEEHLELNLDDRFQQTQRQRTRQYLRNAAVYAFQRAAQVAELADVFFAHLAFSSV